MLPSHVALEQRENSPIGGTASMHHSGTDRACGVCVCVSVHASVCVCARESEIPDLWPKTHTYIYIFELNRWACPLPWPPGRAPLYVFVGTASYVLLHEELVDSLLLPDELHDESVQVDKQSPAKTTGNAAHKHTHTEEVSPNRETERQRQSLTGLTFSQ